MLGDLGCFRHELCLDASIDSTLMITPSTLQVGNTSVGLLEESACGGRAKGALKKSRTGVKVGPRKLVKGRLGCGAPASFHLQAVSKDATGSGKVAVLLSLDRPTCGNLAFWQKLLRAEGGGGTLKR